MIKTHMICTSMKIMKENNSELLFTAFLETDLSLKNATFDPVHSFQACILILTILLKLHIIWITPSYQLLAHTQYFSSPLPPP